MQASFIGLGSMGKAMVKRLLDQGHDITVWNRSPEPCLEMVSLGAKQANDLLDALRSPFVISMLANDDAALTVFSEENIAEMPAQSLHINMASLSTEAVAQLRDRHAAAHVGYLSAPVLGRPPVAEAGQLNIIVAGEERLISHVAPIFEALGKRTWNFGEEVTKANLVKIGVNFNIIHALEALGESVALVEAGGVDPKVFVELLTNSLFAGVAYSGYGNAIATQTYFPAGFSVQLGLKDLSLVEKVASEQGLHLPTLAVLRKVFEETLEEEALQGADWAAIAEVSRKK